MTLRTNLLAAAAAAVGALVFLVLVRLMGSLAFGALAVGAATVVLLSRPRTALALCLGAVIVCEGKDWGVPVMARLYEFVPGPKVLLLELLLALATGATALEILRRGRFELPSPFEPALALLAAALAAGTVTGYVADVGLTAIFEFARTVSILILVPVLMVNLLTRPRDLRLAIGGLGALIVVKVFAGLLALAAGIGSNGVDGTGLTYYESTSNFLTMLFLLTVAAAVLTRAGAPRWATWALPVATACLLLSYRRSFWIATVAAAVLVALLGTGRVGRRLLLPGLAVTAVAVYLAFNALSTAQVESPVAKRLTSLNPTALTTNREDRYRLDERRNVLAELRRAPVTGLGVGVTWQARFPLSVEHENGRSYVHFAGLWWWLKLGVLGLLAYLGLYCSAVVVGLRVFRRHPDPLVRAGGLGASTAMVGLAIAETTATFVGAEVRMTVVVGMLVGLLAVAYRSLPRSDERPVRPV